MSSYDLRIILISTFLFLGGCGSSTGNIKVETETFTLCTDPPKADPVKMREVKPTVIFDEGANVWIAMSVREYENISLNLQDILAHIRQKNAIIKYYKGCIDERSKPD